MICIQQNLPCILVGPSGSGKSVLLQHVASLASKKLVVFSLNADVDTLDLVGGFEQADPIREVYSCMDDLRQALQSYILEVGPGESHEDAFNLVAMLRDHHGKWMMSTPKLWQMRYRA